MTILYAALLQQHMVKHKKKQLKSCSYILYYYCAAGLCQTENDEPQPQVLAAFGLLKVKPRAFKPSWKSICMPAR